MKKFTIDLNVVAPPVLRACLDGGVHYLDIANEIPVAEAVLAADSEARQRAITALPAVGFGTVATDVLARHARSLRLAVELVQPFEMLEQHGADFVEARRGRACARGEEVLDLAVQPRPSLRGAACLVCCSLTPGWR